MLCLNMTKITGAVRRSRFFCRKIGRAKRQTRPLVGTVFLPEKAVQPL